MTSTRKAPAAPRRPRAARQTSGQVEPGQAVQPPVRPASSTQEPEVIDGQAVVFSFTSWLTKNGLAGDKLVEVGGNVYAFRATGSTADNALLLQHMTTGDYRKAMEVMLVDSTHVDALLADLVLPFSTDDEAKLWGDFTRAVSGVRPGESSAS